MRNRFDRQLQQLNEELIEMGEHIEYAIEMASNAFATQDCEKAKEAISYDTEIDQQERDIEALISSALKMITDMERIGDHAADISEMTLSMAGAPYMIKPDCIQKMAVETIDMVIRSVNAFVNKDLEAARWVIKRDDVVDELFDSVKNRLIDLINSNKENGEQASDMLMVAKYFERIGDHATNIAEWVIFSITGTHEDA